MVPIVEIPQKTHRRFLPVDLQISSWEDLESFYRQLLEEDITSVEALEAWLINLSELESAAFEDYAWRKIKMNCDTSDEEIAKSYQNFLREIMPKLAPFAHKLHSKLYDCPWLKHLDQKKYLTLIRAVHNEIELYREENIPIDTEIRTLAQEYGSISGQMTINHEGKEYTFQEAGRLLEEQDQSLRKVVFEKVSQRRKLDEDKVDDIYTKLIHLRTKIAKNTSFGDYTQYAFKELGRFDYSQEDCDLFRSSIEKVIKPVYLSLMEKRRKKLGLDKLFPWDLSVNPFGSEPLRPFKDAREMLEKAIRLFSKLRPELGDMIRQMDTRGFVDLESRVGKAPVAFSFRLPETGIPFIFMNAVGTQSDLTTILHEGGHAIHAFLTRDLPNNEFKNVPSEVAELASMAMELISLDHYDIFYDNPADLTRARRDQLIRTLTLLPWIGAVDAFQKWVYDQPGHTAQERRKEWVRIYHKFHGDFVDWSCCEGELSTLWQKQIHVFEVPFYYIEYAMAQLGAIAVWRNYKTNPEKALDQYIHALSLGYTKTIPEIYEAAGVRFDFSEEYIRELTEFVLAELDAIGD